MLLKPISKFKTLVVEKYITYEIEDSIINIVDSSCRYYGSSLLGRCSGTEFLIGVKYKCPIIVSEIKELIIFPTGSYKNVDTIWINPKMIFKFYNQNNRTLIEFINNKKITLNISTRIISNQILKASRLESILRSKNH